MNYKEKQLKLEQLRIELNKVDQQIVNLESKRDRIRIKIDNVQYQPIQKELLE